MSDAKVESFKKSISKPADAWGKELEKLAKQVEELLKQRDAIGDTLNTAFAAMQTEILKVDIPKDADQKEIAKVPAWFKEILNKKLTVLGKYITSTADARLESHVMKVLISVGWSWKDF